jgi:hypothetical protein
LILSKHYPKNIIHPLFDLLQGKIAACEFETIVDEKLCLHSENCIIQDMEKGFLLSLLKAMIIKNACEATAVY